MKRLTGLVLATGLLASLGGCVYPAYQRPGVVYDNGAVAGRDVAARDYDYDDDYGYGYGYAPAYYAGYYDPWYYGYGPWFGLGFYGSYRFGGHHGFHGHDSHGGHNFSHGSHSGGGSHHGH